MATRASSKKDTSQKPKPKADQPADRAATPQRATDLISPTKKKPPTEIKPSLRPGVPPISKAKQPETVSAPVPAPAKPPAKPESVSLIDETKSKRAEPSGTEPKPRSVLPPISKIRVPILTKAPEPDVQPVPPAQPESVPVASGEPA